MKFEYCIGDNVYSLWNRKKKEGYTIHYGKIKSVSYLSKEGEIYYFLESPEGGIDAGCKAENMFSYFQDAVDALIKLVDDVNK